MKPGHLTNGDFGLPIDERRAAVAQRLVNVNNMLAWYAQVQRGLRAALQEMDTEMDRTRILRIERLRDSKERQEIARYLSETA